MSNIIPPLLSNTPPPPPSPEDDEDDEFGDFTGAHDFSYGCDNLSLPPSPDITPKKTITNGLDINSNSKTTEVSGKVTEKDFQDKRKNEGKSISGEENNKENYTNPDLKNESNMIWVNDRIVEKNDENLCNLYEQGDMVQFNENELSNGTAFEIEKSKNSSRIVEDNFSESILSSGEGKDFNLESDFDSKSNVDEISLKNGGYKNSVGNSELVSNSNNIQEVEERSSEGINVEFNDFEQYEFSKFDESCESTDITSDNKNDSSIKEVNRSKSEKCESNNEAIISPKDNIYFNTITNIHSDNLDGTTPVRSEECNNENDFGNFAFANTNSEDPIDLSDKYATNRGEWEQLPVNVATGNLENMINTTVEDDDFDDFCEFTSNANTEKSQETLQTETSFESEDFGNFTNFSEMINKPVFLLLDEKQALEKAESIIKEIFPTHSITERHYCYVNVENDDFVFNELKDITETNALTYQWSKSASQNMLLKSLNIDARNILYGTPWNPSMPKFAANLGLTPLEPVKSDIPTTSTLKSSPSSTQPPRNDIPSAQFDWNGSGLINPLDYERKQSLDASQVSDDKSAHSIVESSVPQSQITANLTAQKLPSKNDLEQEVTCDQTNDDFDDFASYQVPSTTSEAWPNVVPLRETYISSDVKELSLDIANWLQPTIVTPELPRKNIDLGDEELPNIETPEFTRKQVVLEDDDEFDDFQTVLPNIAKQDNPKVDSEFSKSTETKTEEPKVLNCFSSVDSDSFFGFVAFENKHKSNTNETNQNKLSLESNEVNRTEPSTVDDDDDFTEFQFSTPAPVVPKALTPILEPLKPVPVYPTLTTPSTQINWPDPGITDEEIKKIEMVFKKPQEATSGHRKTDEYKYKANEQPKKTSKHDSLDDDEWSDFVSVQKPSPVHKIQSSEKERSSTPDLPLSVLNLGSIQPTKQPIPVITPHGLIQTKLSSKNSINLSPKTQLKHNPVNSQVQHKNVLHIQPAIISSQFASQVYSFNNGNINQNRKDLNFSLNQPQAATRNAPPHDDDDWSEFVSSPLPSSTSNGYQQNWQSTSMLAQTMWTNSSSNVRVDSGWSVQGGSDTKKVSNLSVSNNINKSTIPSISLPELEFVAPKNRTSSKRK